jgi:L-fuculose-phosphate aldolase
MERLGLVASTSGNLSVREGDVVHITPTALEYHHMTDRDLVTLSLSGEVVDGTREPSSERRLHLAIYAARPEVASVVHTHSVHATAWSFLGKPLDTGTEELEQAAGGTVRTAAEARSGSDAIAQAAVEALAGRRAALLAKHGVIAVGRTPAQALDSCIVVERQAQLAWLLARRPGSARSR